MAKTRNQLESVTLTLTTTPQIRSYLLQLVASGLYGKNAAEAAERLVARVINDLIDNGKLPRARDSRVNSDISDRQRSPQIKRRKSHDK